MTGTLLAYVFTADIPKMPESSDLTISLLILTDKKHLGGECVYAGIAGTEVEKCLIRAQTSLHSKLVNFFHWSLLPACILYWQEGMFAPFLHPALTLAQVHALFSWSLPRAFYLLFLTPRLFFLAITILHHTLLILSKNYHPQMFMTEPPPHLSRCPYNIYIHAPWKLQCSSAPPYCLH